MCDEFSSMININQLNGNEGKNKVMVVTHNSKGNAAQEAERLKNVGNACMQKKEYRKAADCYTTAIRLCPSGPVHVCTL